MVSENNEQPIEPSIKQAAAEFWSFLEEFKNESDRAAVILAGAKLDLLLYQLIQKCLKPCTSRSDELLDGDAPLGSFSARIAMAHRLSLVDDEFCRVLHLIRRIRNSFAHELRGATLDSGAHRDRVRELVAALSGNDAYVYCIEHFFKSDYSARNQFNTVVAIACMRLEGAIRSSSPRTGQPYELVPQHFRWRKASDNDEGAPNDSSKRTDGEAPPAA